ncbi:hypothetical protein MASR2M15_13970 [Anaerolineales bacterium]
MLIGNRIRFVTVLAVVLILSTGCVASRVGVSWPSLSIIEYNGADKILVAYEHTVVMLEPSGEAVKLINPVNGEVRTDAKGAPLTWSLDGNAFGAQFFSAPIWYDEETLLFSTYSEKLILVDSIKPSPETSTTIPIRSKVIADLIEYDGTYLLPSHENGLAAIDVVNKEYWYVPTKKGVWSSPLKVEDKLYFSSMDHFVRAIDLDNLKEYPPVNLADIGPDKEIDIEPVDILWETDLEGAVNASPVYHDGALYVGSMANKLFKLDPDSGEILKSYETQNWIWSRPVIFEDTLYLTDLSGTVYALNPTDLSLIWKSKVAERGIRPSPILTDEFVIVASRDGNIYWIDRDTGDHNFQREVDGKPELLSDMLLVEPNENNDLPETILLVGTMDRGQLVVAYTLNGKPLWKFGA